MERINKWLKDNEYLAWWIIAVSLIVFFIKENL